MTKPQNRESLPFEERKSLLSQAITRRERANPEDVDSFIEPRPGIIAEASLPKHSFIFGRRGSGKSSLVYKLTANLSGSGHPVTRSDVENFRAFPRPNLIAATIHELLVGLRAWLEPKHSERQSAIFYRFLRSWQGGPTSQSNRIIASVNAEIAELREKLGLPADDNHDDGPTCDDLSSPLDEAISAQISKNEDLAQYIIRKQLLYRDLISRVASIANKPVYIFIDDFYRVGMEDQPYLAEYLHLITKGNGAWLKIATVRNRTNSATHSATGRIGILVGPDVSDVDLDQSLEHFPATKQHLMRLLSMLLQEAGFRSHAELFTAEAPDRLIRASGGVARDFMLICRQALIRAETNAQLSKDGRVQPFKVNTEHVYQAIDEFSQQRAAEWRNELGQEESERLLELRTRLTDFCLSQKRNFFSQRTSFGAETPEDLLTLHDLKTVHRVGQKRDGKWTRTLYMLDFSLTAPERKKRKILLQNMEEREGIEQLLEDPALEFSFDK